MVSPSFFHNLAIIFSSLAPCFGLLLERIPYLNNKISFYLTILAFSIFEIYLFFFIFGYSRLFLFIYPLTIILFNIIFTYREGFQMFAKTLSLSLMLSFLLTETHEIANFFYEYTGWFQVLENNLHPFSNLYAILIGYLLFKRFNLNLKNSLSLVVAITLLSFLYYHFAYTASFIIWIRLIQFFIFAFFFYKWGSYQ